MPGRIYFRYPPYSTWTITDSGTTPTWTGPAETVLRERQDVLVRALSVEQNSERLQALSDELEAVQRRLEQVRHG